MTINLIEIVLINPITVDLYSEIKHVSPVHALYTFPTFSSMITALLV